MSEVEIYEHEHGMLYIGHSDKNMSMGLLVLNPHNDFEKHNRPVLEQLTQIQGTSTIKLFEKDKFVKEVKLNQGDKIEIPINQVHIHSNPTDEVSITMWKFEGDITEIIEDLRRKLKKVSNS